MKCIYWYKNKAFCIIHCVVLLVCKGNVKRFDKRYKKKNLSRNNTCIGTSTSVNESINESTSGTQIKVFLAKYTWYILIFIQKAVIS